jgi:N-acyl-D-amino-acid deacylase
MGPLDDAMKEEMLSRQGRAPFAIDWTTLGEYLDGLERRGIASNVASFIGATTVRIHELGFEARQPTEEELERMRGLVRSSMEEGALGVASALIYPPASFARTEELIELSKVAGEYGGMYISHLRSEGDQLLEAIDELLRIAREAEVRAEIYHLKAAGAANWSKLEAAIAKIEAARRDGLEVTADMYTYTAGATGLAACMPPWVQEGGFEAALARLRDPDERRRIIAAMKSPSSEWENLFLAAGSAENILLVGFETAALEPFIGQTLAAVAATREQAPEEAILDLVLEDRSRVEAVYFLMDEANLRRQVQLPWVAFGSDAASLAPEGVFLEEGTHPRAYGNFARLLGRYVREDGLVTVEEAIRRLTSLPASTLRIDKRGTLRVGFYADVAVFDPAAIADLATYEEPHRYALGMRHVFVNGEQVLQDGEHTGALPGRVVRGPGYRPPHPEAP